MSKEVAKKQETMPAFMGQYKGAGTEQLDSSDLEIPRLKVLHALSGPVQEGDCRPGRLYHTTLEEDLGDKLDVVILMVKKRYLLWRPRWDGGGILARADDAIHWEPANHSFEVKPFKGATKSVTWTTKSTVAKSGLAKWGTADPGNPDSPPAATLMYDLAVAVPSRRDLGVSVVTMQRSGIKSAKRLNSKLKTGNVPCFGRVFTAKVKEDHSGDNDYFVVDFVSNGLVTDESEFSSYANLYETLKESGINIKDEEDLQEEDPKDTPDY